jgi:hypothetical protein
MKKFIFVPILFAAFVVLTTQCFNKQAATAQKVAAAVPVKQTHKEAMDTLLADVQAPLKPLTFKALNSTQALAFLTATNLDSLFIKDYPDNGFYGEDRYRIEFLMSTCRRDETDPTLYHVTGKNRHKKTITPYSGTIRITQLSEFMDTNLDTAEYNNMDVNTLYAAQGEFELQEDATAKYSGVFKGKMTLEFATYKTSKLGFWFFSKNLPSGGAGYRMDGTWTSYTKKDMVKPVIVASDLFAIANDILKDFSYGEREVEINEKYRSLGWESFWENDEWWHDAEKPKM